MNASPVLSPRHASDVELLSQLIGVQECQRLYSGSLQPFFGVDSTESVPTPCLIARELVKRWLAEELERRTPFTTPDTVKDYLKLHFAGREYESFVVMYMDAQHCLLAAEELFRGTLTQTSVYPREVVKSALRINAAAVIFSRGCAEFCVNGQSTAGASRPVRKHHEHQETRRPRRTAVWPAGQLQEA